MNASVGSDTLQPEQLPVFYGDRLTRVHQIIDWVHTAVMKTVWGPDRIRDSYLNRSATEILADGDTLAMGPCPDRTAIAAAALTHNGVPYQVVVHERQIAGYGPPTIHVAIELDADRGEFWCDFGFRETRFMRGRYFFNEEIEKTIQIARFGSQDFDPFSLTLPKVLEIVSPQQTEREEKVEWFCTQMETVTPEILRDQIAYEPHHSVYWEEAHPAVPTEPAGSRARSRAG
jgi:hypothetical protein